MKAEERNDIEISSFAGFATPKIYVKGTYIHSKTEEADTLT